MRSSTRILVRRWMPDWSRCSRSSTCSPNAPSRRTCSSVANRAGPASSTRRRWCGAPARCSRTSVSPSSTRPHGWDPSRVAEQQIVEIVKALSFDARVISMDEPTAALSDHEVELLYAIIRRLTARGVAVVYVSHRLKEIFDLCDRITILKDGALVSTDAAADLTSAELVRRMVGRPIQSYFPGAVEGTVVGAPRLELRELRQRLRGRRQPGAAQRRDRRRGGAAGIRPHRARRGDLRRRDLHPGHHDPRRPVAAIEERPRGGQGGTRSRHRRPQGAGTRAVAVGARQRPAGRAQRLHAAHRSGAQGRARHPELARGVLPRSSTRRCASSPAATSRRSCSRSGS